MHVCAALAQGPAYSSRTRYFLARYNRAIRAMPRIWANGAMEVTSCSDKVRIHVKGGDGGAGCMSFRREAHVPRVVPTAATAAMAATSCLKPMPACPSLIDYRFKHHFKAKRGTHGKGKPHARRHGRRPGAQGAGGHRGARILRGKRKPASLWPTLRMTASASSSLKAAWRSRQHPFRHVHAPCAGVRRAGRACARVLDRA